MKRLRKVSEATEIVDTELMTVWLLSNDTQKAVFVKEKPRHFILNINKLNIDRL